MRKALFFLLALLPVLLLAGCGRSSSGKSGDKVGKIVFPSDLERVEGTQEAHPDLSVPTVRLVVFIDSTECSSCRINNLHKYSQYSSLSTLYPGLEAVVVIWPNAEVSENIDKDLAHRKFPFDVFIDRDGSFLRENPWMPSIGRNQHAFLTGNDGLPVVTGDPITSAGRDRLLRNAIYTIYNGN
ncbi:MAG: hypothetical protein J5886_01995 [Bacteroidales bacterium]|nr:hypothetical protein [Bacteroidales bacterium]